VKKTTSIRTTSLRVPAQLLTATQDLAKRRRTSVNALVVESIERTLREEYNKALYDSFTLIGQDDDADVEFAVAAQSEVVNSVNR